MSKNIVIIGAGVAGVNAATKLVDNNFDGKITIIDMGKDPYRRKYNVLILKLNLILLNHILVYAYSPYGTLVQIIYMK